MWGVNVDLDDCGQRVDKYVLMGLFFGHGHH